MVAVGAAAWREAARSALSLRQFHDWPILAASDTPIPVEGVKTVSPAPWLEDSGARSVKLRLFDIVPPDWEYIIYLDADTRVYQPLSPALQMLKDGYNLVIVPSVRQEDQSILHVSEAEREATFNECGLRPVQLQAGAMFVRRSKETERLFADWFQEWQRWRGQDQAALLRALYRHPITIGLLGRPFNGGAVVAHHFGQARNR